MLRWVMVALLAAGPALANNAPAEIGRMQRTGEAKFRWLGIPLYDAALFAEAGSFDWSRPFALELSYRRSIPGDLLVWATMNEMARIEGSRPDHARIETAVANCFPDVSPGDRIVAVAQSPAEVDFWVNGRKRCEVSHPGIRDRFFGIWLSENSRDPKLTRQLIGQQ